LPLDYQRADNKEDSRSQRAPRQRRSPWRDATRRATRAERRVVAGWRLSLGPANGL